MSIFRYSSGWIHQQVLIWSALAALYTKSFTTLNCVFSHICATHFNQRRILLRKSCWSRSRSLLKETWLRHQRIKLHVSWASHATIHGPWLTSRNHFCSGPVSLPNMQAHHSPVLRPPTAEIWRQLTEWWLRDRGRRRFCPVLPPAFSTWWSPPRTERCAARTISLCETRCCCWDTPCTCRSRWCHHMKSFQLIRRTSHRTGLRWSQDDSGIERKIHVQRDVACWMRKAHIKRSAKIRLFETYFQQPFRRLGVAWLSQVDDHNWQNGWQRYQDHVHTIMNAWERSHELCFICTGSLKQFSLTELSRKISFPVVGRLWNRLWLDVSLFVSSSWELIGLSNVEHLGVLFN